MHPDSDMTIEKFDLDILRRCKNPVETRLAEARAITAQGPKINRQFEKPM